MEVSLENTSTCPFLVGFLDTRKTCDSQNFTGGPLAFCAVYGQSFEVSLNFLLTLNTMSTVNSILTLNPFSEPYSIQKNFHDPGFRLEQLQLRCFVSRYPLNLDKAKAGTFNTANLRGGRSERIQILKTVILKSLFRKIALLPDRVHYVALIKIKWQNHIRFIR